MAHNKFLIGLVAGCLSTLLPVALNSAQAAPPKAAAPAAASSPADIPVYGSQLMTDQERTKFRARMWAAKTDAERDRIRAEHHEEMKERAQSRGVTLPDMPPAMPGGAGPRGAGMRPGAGMGPAGGMGTAMAPCAASAPRCAASGPRSGGGHHSRHHHNHHRAASPVNR